MLTEYKIISANEAELNRWAAEGWRFTATLNPGPKVELLLEREGKSERGRTVQR